jgi:hypothetical protein
MAKQVVASTVVGLDEGSSQFETVFSMVSSLSFNTVKCWMVCGQWGIKTYDKTLFSELQKQDRGTSVELGDDATYPT